MHSASDYDFMPLLNAVIKVSTNSNLQWIRSIIIVQETLCVHPFVTTLIRVATQDDVIPFSEPITAVDGTVM